MTYLPGTLGASRTARAAVPGDGRRSVDDIVARLRRFPFEPLPLPVQAAFTRQFGADASVLLFGNARRFSSPHRYPAPFRAVEIPGYGGVPLAATVAMQPGPAPLLVLCHGLFMTMRFRALIKLAQLAYERWGFHVVAFDARGCGRSAWLNECQMTGGWLEGRDTIEIVRRLRRDPRVTAAHAVGISLGGSTVLNAARVESDERAAGAEPALDSVISVSGPTRISEAVAHISDRPPLGHDFLPLWGLFRLGIRINARRVGVHPGDGTFRHAVANWLAVAEGVDADEFCTRSSAASFGADIHIPTLHLHASDDFCVPVLHGHALADAAADNPDVHVWIVERGNHAAFDAVARRWYRSVLRRWCEYWTPPAPPGTA